MFSVLGFTRKNIHFWAFLLLYCLVSNSFTCFAKILFGLPNLTPKNELLILLDNLEERKNYFVSTGLPRYSKRGKGEYFFLLHKSDSILKLKVAMF